MINEEWAGLGRDTLLYNLRMKEVQPPERTEEEEKRLIVGLRVNGIRRTT